MSTTSAISLGMSSNGYSAKCNARGPGSLMSLRPFTEEGAPREVLSFDLLPAVQFLGLRLAL